MKTYKMDKHNSEQMLNVAAKKEAAQTLSDCFNIDSALLDNPFLITRTGLISKLLMLSTLYDKLKKVPGDFVEFGVWMGQSLILWENLRAIHEPFNIARSLYGFDTFEGYVEQSKLEIQQSEIDKYNVGESWIEKIQTIFLAHCKMNNSNMSLDLIKGDVLKTVPEFYKSYHGMIACAYIDIATYETTNTILKTITPKMAKGGIIIIDDFGPAYPGVSEALKDNNIMNFNVNICPFYPTKIYLEKL